MMDDVSLLRLGDLVTMCFGTRLGRITKAYICGCPASGGVKLHNLMILDERTGQGWTAHAFGSGYIGGYRNYTLRHLDALETLAYLAAVMESKTAT